MDALEIDLDHKCSKCGRSGATPCGLCLKCVTDQIVKDSTNNPYYHQKRYNFNFSKKKFTNDRQEELF